MVKLNDEASIPLVVAEMTLEEKVYATASPAPVQYLVERLGIPAYTRADGHNGLNMMQLMGRLPPSAGEPKSEAEGMAGIALYAQLGMDGLAQVLRGQLSSETLARMSPQQQSAVQALAKRVTDWLPEGGLPTCFPPGLVMGATWNPTLVGACAQAVAKEAKAFEVDILLGPNVNIIRDPLCGRAFESYSEDPYLASRLVVAYCRELQKEGVAANVKHFCANNQETLRIGINEIISERALREIYYPAFKAAVQEGGSWTVMSAYNNINGVSCAHSHHLLTEVLRDEWGFEGFVISDAGAVYNSVAALKAGNDMEMPPPSNPPAIIDAVRSGDLPEAVLDRCVSNILRILLKLPAFAGREREARDLEFSVRMAREIAVQGAVLLKNEYYALPLEKPYLDDPFLFEFPEEQTGPLAVLGENARHSISTGGGSAGVISPYVVSLLEGLEARFGSESVVFGEIPEDARAGIVSVGMFSGEGSDRQTLKLPIEDVALIRYAAQKCDELDIPSIVVLNVCGPVEVYEWIDEVDAVLLMWLGGQEHGHAAAALLAGDENPSGKLPLTWPRRYADTPAALNFPGEVGEVVYGEGIYVGYRYYDAKDVQPQFPFGYGLSFTDFELGNLRLSSKTLDLTAEQSITVQVDVTNTGLCAGTEVVQLYIADPESTLQKPPKQLKGFERVTLDAGETTTIDIQINAQSLQHYDPKLETWCVEPGVFYVWVGTSSRDLPLRATFVARGPNPYGYGPRTSIRQIFADPRAWQVLQRYMPPQMRSPAMMGVLLEFMPDMPLASILERWAGNVPTGMGTEQAEQVKAQLYAELAEIEV